MKEILEKIRQEALAKMEQSDSLDRLNEIRVAYLGKKGELTQVLKSMRDVAAEDRPKIGQMVNETREALEARLEAAKAQIAAKQREQQLARIQKERIACFRVSVLKRGRKSRSHAGVAS